MVKLPDAARRKDFLIMHTMLFVKCKAECSSDPVIHQVCPTSARGYVAPCEFKNMQFRINLDGLCFRVNIVHIASALDNAFNGCLTRRNDSLDIGTYFCQFSPSREIGGIPFVPNQGGGIFPRSIFRKVEAKYTLG